MSKTSEAYDAGPGGWPQGGVERHFQARADGSGVALLASRCRHCGSRMFPPRSRCAVCFGHDLETQPLPGEGSVLTLTVVRQAPPGYHGPVPYVLGQVVISDDITVLAHLVGKPPDAWKAGDAVRSVAMTLPVRTDGCTPPMTCYAFEPANR